MRSQCFSTPKEAVDAFRMHVLEILDIQQLVQTNAKVFILMGNILKNNKAIFDD